MIFIWVITHSFKRHATKIGPTLPGSRGYLGPRGYLGSSEFQNASNPAWLYCSTRPGSREMKSIVVSAIAPRRDPTKAAGCWRRIFEPTLRLRNALISVKPTMPAALLCWVIRSETPNWANTLRFCGLATPQLTYRVHAC